MELYEDTSMDWQKLFGNKWICNNVSSIGRLSVLLISLFVYFYRSNIFEQSLHEWSPPVASTENPNFRGIFDQPNDFPIVFERQFSSFDCGGWSKWPVSPNYVNSMEVFQDWIFAWQHSCDKDLNRNPPQSWGIGRTIHLAIKHLITSIESRAIYRPNEQNAARVEEDKSKCTLSMRTIDCYFQPLSTCGTSYSSNKSVELIQSALNFSRQGIDTCTMARLSQKPLQWVHGQFFHYMTRLREDLQIDVDERKARVFAQLKNISSSAHFATSANAGLKRYGTIGVHVRGGDPDANRKVANLTYYIQAIDFKAAELARKGRPVGLVYLCSDSPDENIISSESMQERFPRPFRFVVLPHTLLPGGRGEVETKLRSHLGKDAPRRQLFMEYMTDIEILASTDYFIGTFSSVYPLVTGLRIARGDGTARHTSCFLDTMKDVPPLVCEGDAASIELWRHFFGGYNGGTSF